MMVIRSGRHRTTEERLHRSDMPYALAMYDCIGNPYNESPKHWIGINPSTAPDGLLKEMTRNSYEIVKAKYKKHDS